MILYNTAHFPELKTNVINYFSNYIIFELVKDYNKSQLDALIYSIVLNDKEKHFFACVDNDFIDNLHVQANCHSLSDWKFSVVDYRDLPDDIKKIYWNTIYEAQRELCKRMIDRSIHQIFLNRKDLTKTDLDLYDLILSVMEDEEKLTLFINARELNLAYWSSGMIPGGKFESCNVKNYDLIYFYNKFLAGTKDVWVRQPSVYVDDLNF